MDTAKEMEHRLHANGHSNNGHSESVPENIPAETAEPAVAQAIEAPVKRHQIRNFLGKAAVLGAAFISASTLGLMFRGTDTEVAGQSVTTKETLDNRLTIHTGITGTLSIPMENFTEDLHGFGADIHISDGQDANETNFAGIVSLSANPEPDVERAKNEALKWGAIWGLGGALGLYAISKSKLINPEYRKAFVEVLGGENVMRVCLASSMLAGAAIPATYQALKPAPESNVSPIFDDTFLEGATATGWMQTLINDVGVEVVDRVESIRDFSDQASAGVRKAFDNDPKIFNTDGTVTVVSFAGLHCNPAMMPVIGQIMRSAHANFGINAGDEVIGEEGFDPFCLYGLASQTRGTKIYAVGGSHRTSQTIEQAEAEGITEMEEGKIYEEDGLTMIGAPDPYPDASLEQEPDSPGHPERPALGRKLAETAEKYHNKEHKQVSIAVLNQPGAATPVADSGYVNSVITGGNSSDVRSYQYGDDETTFTFESSAGGVINIPDLDQLTWSQPPLAPANVYIDNYDPKTGKKLWSKIVTIDPTGDKPTVSIGHLFITSFGNSKAGQKILFGSK